MNPTDFDPIKRADAYSESSKIGIDDLPLLKQFDTLDELIGFIDGVVGRSNFKITMFKAVVRVESP